ncbi:MAG TPA: hypothetical protein VMU13_01410 [Candidatus Paceibacterota bacterium]|nr:hypothetical protein [Candidatus Paceibacterota bacterium]
MADDKHAAPDGLFSGTIFEGGFSGGHAESHEWEGWGHYIEHNTKFGHFIFEYLAEFGVSRALSLWIVFIGLWLVLSVEIRDLPLFTLEWTIGTAPVWLPIVLLISSWFIWIWYIQSLFISGRDPVLLDIKIPREITKSPRAMELALVSFYATSGESSFIDRIWEGKVRVWYSFEYASFGGEVHMYVWCWKTHRRAVEAALYAQFPEIEIHQTEDYAAKFKFDPHKHKVFINEHVYANSDVYPLKTYIEFELDKDPDEEFKVDPMAQGFEYLSSLLPGEQAWIQVVFRASGKYGSMFKPKNKAKEWLERVKKEVANVRKLASQSDVDPGKESFPRPTWRQTEQMRIIERQMGKIPFDVAVCGFYIADQSVYNGAVANGTRWFWKPINNPGYLNALEPTRGHNAFDYPWQDFMKIRDGIMVRRYIDAYRRRCPFYSPWVMEYQTMTNEVLATMFHFPSSSVVTPGLERIASTKAEPPSNLPK